MRTRILTTAAMILMATGGSWAAKSLAFATLAPPPGPATISIDELQSQVDTQSLPELEAENLF